MKSTPAVRYGLLLDVDGPICSPENRSIDQPTIVPNLISLIELGIPVIFNTGRSADFLTEQVFEPLLAAGLPPKKAVHGVCEKGGVWLTLTQEGIGARSVDESVAPPREFPIAIEQLVQDKFSDTMFFDDTKLAMVSVEQIVGVPAEDYYAAQQEFDRHAFDILSNMGIGVELHDRVAAPESGKPMFRIDPTIISTDIESVVLGKDFGAQRALQLLGQHGVLPDQWRTVGDSRTDYKMADWLHSHGHKVVHVDVRPADGVPSKPYPVIQAQRSVNDVAGARWLDWLVANVNAAEATGSGVSTEADFDAQS